MSQQKINTIQKPPFKLKPSDAFVPKDDDNRIDWQRKKKKKPEDEDSEPIETELLEVEDVEAVLLDPRQKPKQAKKGKKDKRRQLIMDEDTGRVFVKRRRKNNRSYDQWDDYE